MASTWRTAQLGELVIFKTGKLDSNAAVANGDYPFFTCSQETFRTNTFSFDAECVLLAGNNANGIYPLKYFCGKFDAYQRTYVITARDPNQLAIRFLYYALRQKLSEFQSFSTGAATKFLTMKILNRTEIQVPSLEQQQRIASILGAYDDLIDVNQRRIALMEDMARHLFSEWFGRFRFPGYEGVQIVETPDGPLPAGWSYRGLHEVAEVAFGFPFKSPRFNGEGIGIPVVRIRDILDSRSETYTDEAFEPRYAIKDGDLLVGMDGIFHTAIWSGGKAALNQRVTRLRPLDNRSVGWLYLSVLPKIKHLEATISGTTVAHLSARDLKAMRVLAPSGKTQALADQAFSAFDCAAINYRHQQRRLAASRDHLLPRLVSGELSVTTAERELEALA